MSVRHTAAGTAFASWLRDPALAAAALAVAAAVMAAPSLAQPAPQAVPRYTHAGVPPPTAEDIAAVKPEWYTDLHRRVVPCNGATNYGACVRVYIALHPPFDPARRELFGEKFDAAKYYECRMSKPMNDASCERLILARRESPETWPYHLGKPAPIKWPDPPKEQVYKPGMSALEYWRALCKAEAGEFIYRTVPDVTAIYQIRPRAKENERAYSDRYVMEDPYGYIEAESGTLDKIPWFVAGPGWTSRKSPGSYPVFETPILENSIHAGRQQYFPAALFQPIPPGKPYQRFFDYDQSSRNTMRMDYTDKLESRYGWTWRGIRRPHDREVGVAGGELAVVDLKTGEILGLRRGFILGSIEAGKPVNWFHGNVCPEYALMPGIGQIRNRNKDMDFSLWFIDKVLQPIGQYRD